MAEREYFDYTLLDTAQRWFAAVAAETAGNSRFGTEVPSSRGESAYLREFGDRYDARVIEGLGTKHRVAEAIEEITGDVGFHESIGYSAAATVLNDLGTCGATPVDIGMHLAVGDASWFRDTGRYEALAQGWRRACDDAGCDWGYGEMPQLKGVVVDGTYAIDGAASGIIQPKERRLHEGRIEAGDAIILFGSSSVHDNGLSDTHVLADRLPEGYLTWINEKVRFGEALLPPTRLYTPVVQKLLDAEVPVHYAINITGHGWRKLMRPKRSLGFEIEQVPNPQDVFAFIQKELGWDDSRMYATFNMGAGFAIIAPEERVSYIKWTAEQSGYECLQAGTVVASDESYVRIGPLDVQYSKADLQIRN